MTIRSRCRPPGSWAALPVTIKLIHHPARHGVAGIRTSRYRLPVDPPHIPAQERREQWTTDGSVRALLYQMVRNVALNQLKGDDTHSRLLELRAEHPAPRTPVEELGAAEVQRAFEDAVADLPERRREVFLLARL